MHLHWYAGEDPITAILDVTKITRTTGPSGSCPNACTSSRCISLPLFGVCLRGLCVSVVILSIAIYNLPNSRRAAARIPFEQDIRQRNREGSLPEEHALVGLDYSSILLA